MGIHQLIRNFFECTSSSQTLRRQKLPRTHLWVYNGHIESLLDSILSNV